MARITAEKEQEILDTWAKHPRWVPERVARECGVHPHTVRTVVKRAGGSVEGRRRSAESGRRLRDDAIRRELKDLAAGRGKHRSMADIGRKYDLSREWVRRIGERR